MGPDDLQCQVKVSLLWILDCDTKKRGKKDQVVQVSNLLVDQFIMFEVVTVKTR